VVFVVDPHKEHIAVKEARKLKIPIVAIVSGILILQEPLSALQAVAIASTAISLWLALVPGRQR